ncbi:MAG: hypothetical protein V1772_12500 [Chloroflexota bacterium]
MKISDIRLVQVRGRIPRRLAATEERQVGALDLYPEYRARTVTPPTPEELAGDQPSRRSTSA